MFSRVEPAHLRRFNAARSLYYSVATAMPQRTQRWDVFCSVIDNFGDAGVCWRLARQLAGEHGLQVRLYVDALPALARIAPAVDAKRDDQRVEDVEIRRWTGAASERSVTDTGDAVIEAFGCGLPQPYLAAMAARDRQPPWINLEYLSAEAWIEGCHGLASRHPLLPLTRHFFFPGFTRASGGLLRERDLFRRRDAYLSASSAQHELWRRLGTAKPERGTTVVSLFCYPNAPIASLLAAWAEGGEPVLLLLPDGVAEGSGSANEHARQQTRGRLTLARIPFLSQEDYDRLLWQCDINFVRGEDSFVRAQWAARPFVWQPYPQNENAHRLKLEAFLERYAEGAAPDAAESLRAFALRWNGDVEGPAPWGALLRAARDLSAHAQLWAERLSALPDLAQNLVKFCADRV